MCVITIVANTNGEFWAHSWVVTGCNLMSVNEFGENLCSDRFMVYQFDSK